MKNLLKIMLTASLCVSASIAAPQKGSMTDPRDGKTYKTVKIGKYVWMAENLNYETENSYCYDNDLANCQKYGRLYTWEAALNACPEGWRLPTNADFETLFANVRGIETAGKMLKSRTGWEDYEGKSGNGIDKYGFNVLPAGIRNNDGSFNYAGRSANFWSATEYKMYGAAYLLDLSYPYEDAPLLSNFKDRALSVRCLRGSVPQKSTDSNEGSCSNSDVLDLTILLKDDYVQIGARGGFQPNIYFNEMWTFRCKANGQRVTYTAKDVQENLGRGYGPKCPNGKEISPDKYINELEKIELWTIENESVDMLVEDMLMNELSRIYNQFKNLEDAGKITIFIDDKRNHDMKWIKKKYGPILNKIQKLGFKEIYFPSDVESSMRSETENAIYYDTRFVIKYDDAHANQLYKTFGVRKPSKANFAKENKRCHNSLVTIEMKNEQAFIEKMENAFKDSAAVNKILKDVASKMSKEKDPSESSGGGIGDGLAGLFSGKGGKNAIKAIGNIESPSADDVGVTGSIDHERVMKVVRQRLPGLSHLYNKYLKKKPGFQGKVVLKIDVNVNGQVTYISVTSSTANYPEFENEIAEAVSRWKFENSTGNAIITIPCTFKINE